MSGRSYEFIFRKRELLNIINKITLDIPYNKLLYKYENNNVIGYITFEKSIRDSSLKKYSSDIKWVKTTSEFIKSLNKNEFNFSDIKPRKTKKNEEKNEIIEKLAELAKEVKELKENNIQQQTIIKNQTQNIQININNINSFKSPSTDHMNNDDFFNFINAHGLNGITRFIEKLYFKNKTNYSLYIENDRYNTMYVYHDNKWLLTNRNNSIGEIFNTCSHTINSWFEDVSGQIEIEQDDENPIVIDYIDEDEIEETENKVIEKRDLLDNPNISLYNDVKLLIVNNSNKVKNLIKN